jgi:hypothetical protein
MHSGKYHNYPTVLFVTFHDYILLSISSQSVCSTNHYFPVSKVTVLKDKKCASGSKSSVY